jgi:nicotinamide-nucleotide adenylyltransferase
MIENPTTVFQREWLPDLAVLEPYMRLHDEEALLEKKRNLQLIAQERIPGEDRIGLVVGRFQPPHAGHFYLIEAALAVSDNVVIGIGSANARDEKNPFTALRREMILRSELKKNGLNERVKFVYLNDYDKDTMWCDKTLEQANQWGKINVIVGNNGLVNNIFRKKGYRALEIPELYRTELNATDVRADLREKGFLLPFGTTQKKVLRTLL